MKQRDQNATTRCTNREPSATAPPFTFTFAPCLARALYSTPELARQTASLASKLDPKSADGSKFHFIKQLFAWQQWGLSHKRQGFTPAELAASNNSLYNRQTQRFGFQTSDVTITMAAPSV